MRHCTTLALLLSLSACERASQPTQPSTPDLKSAEVARPAPLPPTTANTEPPPPKPLPAISAQPRPVAKKPVPKAPCSMRVCPEWETETRAVEQPVEVRQLGISRAYVPWRDEKAKVRIKQVAPETKVEAGK